MDTIFAHCSGKGKAGVAVFRLSGPYSLPILQKLTRKPQGSFAPRQMVYAKIYDLEEDYLVDEAMVVYFAADSSFTGEEIVEIHVHGSLAVMSLMHKILLSNKNLRIAQPGEFIRRAFMNCKYDLTQVEGLADLLDAETEMQHKQAIRQLDGGLEELYHEWRAILLETVANLEASVEFPEDIAEDVLGHATDLIKSLCNKIKKHLADNRRGERLRNGIRVGIIGKPNVGKSSLLNCLMQRDLAIVSDVAGTTRDVIEGHLNVAGYPILLQDAAGVRKGQLDQIEEIGIAKAKRIYAEADIRLIVLDAVDVSSDLSNAVQEFAEYMNDGAIIICNKIDLLHDNQMLPSKILGIDLIKMSILKATGVETLLNLIATKAAEFAAPGEVPMITRERHRVQLQQALELLQQFNPRDDLSITLSELRRIINCFGDIIGTVTTDEVLDRIFATFCIGK